jgi:hypothetical protein
LISNKSALRISNAHNAQIGNNSVNLIMVFGID